MRKNKKKEPEINLKEIPTMPIKMEPGKPLPGGGTINRYVWICPGKGCNAIVAKERLDGTIYCNTVCPYCGQYLQMPRLC